MSNPDDPRSAYNKYKEQRKTNLRLPSQPVSTSPQVSPSQANGLSNTYYSTRDTRRSMPTLSTSSSPPVSTSPSQQSASFGSSLLNAFKSLSKPSQNPVGGRRRRNKTTKKRRINKYKRRRNTKRDH
jgi:hypothetical protein